MPGCFASRAHRKTWHGPFDWLGAAGFGRNSKVLHSWTRAQINVALGSPDPNGPLVIACGKCSNGQEFSPFAIQLDADSMIYTVQENFSLDDWQANVTGKNDCPSITPERVGQLCRAGMAKADLSKAIQADCGCSRQMSYKHINKAEQQRRIKWNPKAEHFTPLDGLSPFCHPFCHR